MTPAKNRRVNLKNNGTRKGQKKINFLPFNQMLFSFCHSRKENTFTDVRIKVEEQEFPVHKCVLSSFSPYFKVRNNKCVLSSFVPYFMVRKHKCVLSSFSPYFKVRKHKCVLSSFSLYFKVIKNLYQCCIIFFKVLYS